MQTVTEPQEFRLDLFLQTLLAMVRERTVERVFNVGRQYFLSRDHVAATMTWLADAKSQTLKLCQFESRCKTSPETWKINGRSMAEISYQDNYIGKVARERVPRALYGDTFIPPEWAKQESIRSCMFLPMETKTGFMGVFGLFFYPRFETGFDDSLKWLGMLADYFGAALSNAQSFESIEQIRQSLIEENRYLRQEVHKATSFGDIIGQSQCVQTIFTQIKTVARTDANVFITGESGTGKELIAKAIHRMSHRSKQPLIKVNCAAVPKDLFESEFFGHIKGAFTGAIKDRVGRFQLADKGTLLLDEVGEIPPALQSKLLRVIQEGEFERIGEGQTRTVSVRIIAITNRNLQIEMQNNRFREDLYYRLSVYPIIVPPLRERREDIPFLVDAFIEQSMSRLGFNGNPVLSDSEYKFLMSLPWPGNIRELQNAVERAVITGKGQYLDFGFLSYPVQAKDTFPTMIKPHTDQIIHENQWRQWQRENIIHALELANWKVQGKNSASQYLGIKPTTLRSRMERLGINK